MVNLISMYLFFYILFSHNEFPEAVVCLM